MVNREAGSSTGQVTVAPAATNSNQNSRERSDGAQKGEGEDRRIHISPKNRDESKRKWEGSEDQSSRSNYDSVYWERSINNWYALGANSWYSTSNTGR